MPAAAQVVDLLDLKSFLKRRTEHRLDVPGGGTAAVAAAAAAEAFNCLGSLLRPPGGQDWALAEQSHARNAVVPTNAAGSGPQVLPV